MYSHVQRKQCVPSLPTTSANIESSSFVMSEMDQMDQVMEEADITGDIDMNEETFDEGKHLSQ